MNVNPVSGLHPTFGSWLERRRERLQAQLMALEEDRFGDVRGCKHRVPARKERIVVRVELVPQGRVRGRRLEQRGAHAGTAQLLEKERQRAAAHAATDVKITSGRGSDGTSDDDEDEEDEYEEDAANGDGEEDFED